MIKNGIVVIFSISKDQGTNGVVRWLRYFGLTVLRFNDDEPFGSNQKILLTESDCIFECGGKSYSLSDIDAVWYRKGSFWFSGLATPDGFDDDPELRRLLDRKLKTETMIVSKFLYRLIKMRPIRVLGNPILGDPNKLEMLLEAKSVGLSVPTYEVTTRLSPRHISQAENYITKAISDGIYLWDLDGRRRGYFTYTEGLNEVLDEIQEGDKIPLSLIQENIEKEFELRVFYIDGVFCSTVIYSQNDRQTAVDYRKYNTKNPNRNAPFELPEDVKRKLKEFFVRIELNTGSVDMIVTPKGEFVFLEVNPFGIYSGISEVCNLNIDRVIALWLRGGECAGTEIVKNNETAGINAASCIS